VSIGRRSANNFQAAARTLNQQLIVVNARTDSDLEMEPLASPFTDPILGRVVGRCDA
jgi:hypothetical protein